MYGQLVSAIQLAMHEVLIGMLLIEQVPFCLLCTWLGGWWCGLFLVTGDSRGFVTEFGFEKRMPSNANAEHRFLWGTDLPQFCGIAGPKTMATMAAKSRPLSPMKGMLPGQRGRTLSYCGFSFPTRPPVVSLDMSSSFVVVFFGAFGFLLHAILVLHPTHLAESDRGHLPVFPCTWAMSIRSCTY